MELSGVQQKQERSLRAMQMVTISGFLEDNRSLQESCLVLCNLCREFVPLRCLKVDLARVPFTLLAVLWPAWSGLFYTKAERASRVLLSRSVLKLDWEFQDPWTDTNSVEDERESDNGKEGYSVEDGPLAARGVDMSKVRLPEGVTELYLWGFNRCIDEIVWPLCLQVLSFHMPSSEVKQTCFVYGSMDPFNRPLDGVTFPAGLRELILGDAFKQCIDAVALPESLELLSMPGYNHPIHNVKWPPRLKTLEFIDPYGFERRESATPMHWIQYDGRFNQPLGSFLPTSLETLWLSDIFNQSLRGVTWPNGLTVLGLGKRVSAESLAGAVWPSSLRKLVMSHLFGIDEDLLPACEVTYVVPPEFSLL